MQAFICRSAVRGNRLFGLLLAAPALLLAACAPVTPQWDTRFGESTRAAAAQQTLNPDAGKNPDRVAGVDGRAAAEAMERYQESFQKPPPPPPLFQIMTGAGSGG